MHRHANRVLVSLAVVLALAGVTAEANASRWIPGMQPGATEQRVPPMPRATCHQYCGSVDQHLSRQPVPTVRPRIVTVVADAGFNWSDAAIGFGVACGLLFLGLGSRLLHQTGLRRHRTPA